MSSIAVEKKDPWLLLQTPLLTTFHLEKLPNGNDGRPQNHQFTPTGRWVDGNFFSYENQV